MRDEKSRGQASDTTRRLMMDAEKDGKKQRGGDSKKMGCTTLRFVPIKFAFEG